MRIEIWSDYVCPYCYIGKRRLEIALEQFFHNDKIEVEYKSFELDPNAPKYSDQDIYESLAAKYGVSVEQVKEGKKQGSGKQAAELGLIYNFDDMKPTNTFDAHRLTKYAKTLGKEKEISESLFYAYFTDSKNIGDLDTLADIAEINGIDRANSLRILNSEEFTDDVRNDQQLARQHRITGVPFYVINGRYAISGAQPIHVFIEGFKKALAEEYP